MGAADRERWEPRWAAEPEGEPPGGPEPFLARREALLPPGPVLDAPCGDGRNALWLAAPPRGRRVAAVDIAPSAVRRLLAAARARGLAVEARAADLDDPRALDGLGGPFAALVVTRFRPSPAQWATLAAALAPGGRLLLCSFARAHAARTGFPAAFCLEDRAGLEALLAPLGLRLVAHEAFEERGALLEGSLWERAALPTPAGL